MHRVIWLAAAVVALSGCASTPATYDVQNTRTYSESKDVVWERVVGFFAANSLAIKTIEKDSGIIAAERLINRPAGGKILGWADCGTDPLNPAVAQTVDLNVFVRPAPSGSTVSVNTRFSERRQLGNYPAITVDCNSTGQLERLILDVAGGQG